jgi:hypothetical protein
VLTSSRIRALVLGLLAVMLVGSVTAGAAWAEPGPFWHHREVGGKGEGSKIEPTAAESFSGKGGVQTFASEIGGVKVLLTSAATQVKGAIFNAEHQGQIKIVIFYQPPEVKINGEPASSECVGSVGQQSQFSNIVQLKGHLAWKWNGTLAQLEEQPQKEQNWDIVFTQTEPQRQSETGFPLVDLRKAAGTFAEINLKGAGCKVLAGVQKVGGAEVGIPSPAGLGEFSKKLGVRTIASGTLPSKILENTVEGEGFLQHIWVGLPTGKKEFQPLILGLTFAGKGASLIGQTETEAAQQEIAVTEK